MAKSEKENKVIQMHSNPRLNAALAYAAIGWHVLPAWWAIDGKCACGKEDCRSPAKHPIGKLAPWGQNSSTTDAEKIKQWWEQYPEANIAAYLEPSNLVAIDIDPRNGGFQSIEDIEAKHGKLASDLMQFSGGGGEHRIFSRPKDTTMPGKLGPGVDVKANGYIMLEPSNHVSGGFYSWEASSDPRDGVMASPLPDWLRDLAVPSQVTSGSSADDRPIGIGDDTKNEVIEALGAVDADSREVWLKVGMALHSVGDNNWAFNVWDQWSKQSKKYDHVDQIRVWRSFKSQGLDGLTYKTIFGLAKEAGLVVVPLVREPVFEEVPIESVSIKKLDAEHPVDPILLTPPGILRDVVDWINASSPRPQPQFAVQAAIAFAAAVLGRRFSTNHGNWAPMYLLNIGVSASGKEFGKYAVEHLLESCGLNGLIGPNGYSSDTGVMSTLHTKPNHVAVIDEFHRVLEQASIKGNARSQGMLRAIIECWGRTDGTMRAVGYSTVGLSAKDAKALQDRDVANPSLTLLAMAIPSFWESIGSAAAKDGFLNRFLIVETSIGRQVGQFIGKQAVPQSIIDWATSIRSLYTGLVDPDTNALPITPVVVGITPAAMKLFEAFSAECIALMDAHEADGLAEMFGRSNETAMKLALIIACSRSASVVSEQDAEWAILYVKTYSLRTVQRLKDCMADSEFEAAKKQVLQILMKHGEPLNMARICDRSRKIRSMTKRQQIEVMDSLIYIGKVQAVERPGGHSGRGQKTPWYVSVENCDD